MPERVTLEVLAARQIPAGMLPVGIYEDTLGVAGFDFEETAMARAVFQRRRNGISFMRALVSATAASPAWELSVLDISQLLGAEKPSGCAYATRKPELAAGYLQNLLAHAAEAAPAMRLVIVTGMGALVNTVPFDQANEFKRLLQGLPLAGSVRILLVDAQADVSYGYEDWFKAHVSNKDGLWVGPIPPCAPHAVTWSTAARRASSAS